MSKRTETSQPQAGVLLSRRRFLTSTAATLAAGGVLAAGRVDLALAQDKTSKADAAYQDTPNGDERCSGCVHFISGENACRIVEGDISPDGWCRLFAAG